MARLLFKVGNGQKVEYNLYGLAKSKEVYEAKL